MEPHVERMLEEHKELQTRTQNLVKFIDTNPIFNGLSHDEQYDMRIQLRAMQTYLIVLTRRIERATNKGGEA